MTTRLLITIFILFLLSNNLYSIVWDIIKSFFYLVLMLIGLKFINEPLAKTIQSYLIKLISLDPSLIIATTQNISESAKEFVNSKLLKNNDSILKSNN
jgi:hypothetical protein